MKRKRKTKEKISSRIKVKKFSLGYLYLKIRKLFKIGG